MTVEPFVHRFGICESKQVGQGTRVWAFAHILPGAVIGRDCNICDHVFIENDVVLGDRVTVKSGVQLWDGLRIGADVFIGPNVSFSNDRFPRSKQYRVKLAITSLERGCSLGASSTLLPGVTIGRRAMVGAGAVVTKDVPPYSVVVGNPARIVSYVDDDDEPVAMVAGSGDDRRIERSEVGGVSLHRLIRAEDRRGKLVAAEFGVEPPFVPRRAFVVYDVPSMSVRGEHAHRECAQFLVCLTGSVAVTVDDGRSRDQYVLSDPGVGLYIPPLIWAIQHSYSGSATLVVFASHFYDPADYIRRYEELLGVLGIRRAVAEPAPGP